MEKIKAVYSKMIADFFAEQIDQEAAIVFFQGFPDDFYVALSRSSIRHFRGIEFDTLPDVEAFDSGQLVQSFIASSGCVWGFYEELIALANELNNFGICGKKVYVVKNNLYDGFYPLSITRDRKALHRLYEDDLIDIDTEPLLEFYSGYKEMDGVSYFAYVNKHYPVDISIKVEELLFFSSKSGYFENEDELPQRIIGQQELPLLKLRLTQGSLTNQKHIIKTFSRDLEPEVEALNCLGSFFRVHFSIDRLSVGVDQERTNKYLAILKEYWGTQAEFYQRTFYKEPAYDNRTFELSQGVLVSNIIEQCETAIENSDKGYSDLIVTAPTGAGKSLFFQLPGIHLHKHHQALTIVVCPLLALMRDQIQELRERGVEFATFINSEITYEQRQERLNGISTGQYSIVYLSPELLLAYDIDTLVGDRKIGLFVIDEAHLVTSWGRDFRVDYWFLGDYLERIRRGSYYNKHKDRRPFPVLCLTATAVYGGRDDVLGDLQRSLNLNCSPEHLYVGYVKRDNIGFEINNVRVKTNKSQKEQKVLSTCQRVEQFIGSQEKSIVYFPYVSQIEDVERELNASYGHVKGFVERYSGSRMHTVEKNEAYNRFREADYSVMLATKAFGMGINIPDITNVYHFAPTGTLADYVQEIGRAARKVKQGYAIIDYLPNDMRYAQTLWGLSGLRHYQIKAIMKKLYDLYMVKQSRHLLFSADVFSHLFDPNSLDMKVKSGLMLLSADLLETYHFRVINVRPKNLFSTHYIVVPNEVEREFRDRFGGYSTRMLDDTPRITPAYGTQATVVTSNIGNIFEIDLAKVWENEFEELTFAKFKYQFFNGDLFHFGVDKVVPRIKLVITYEPNYDISSSNLLVVAQALQRTFNDLRRKFGGKQFNFPSFATLFGEHYGQKVRREYLLLLLDIFCYETTNIHEIPSEQWKFIERRRGKDDGNRHENMYSMRTSKHGYIERNLKRFLRMAAPNDPSGKKFIAYLPVPRVGQKHSEYQLLASLLELFGLATYDMIGGRNPQIFVRINDPQKLARISSSDKEYRNRFLADIDRRHKRAALIIQNFMTGKFTDEERWSLIENYFLGFDNEVDYQLGIKEAAASLDL